MDEAERVEGFIDRWQGREGGQERANYQLFLLELCRVLDVPDPDPADATTANNDYVFERAVREVQRDGTATTRRIDLYRRDCFVLEAKQSRWQGRDKELPGARRPNDNIPQQVEADAPRGRRGAGRGWDVLMHNARRQAEDYVRLLPEGHEPPPFVLVCDVGHCIEVFANFRRDGKAYDQFPDRRGFRVYLEDLRDPAIRERLRAIWLDPMALDPARHAARVTRDIAGRLAAVSKALETAGHPPAEVATFLMRVLFTMFAEDVGLLEPEGAFTGLLADCEDDPAIFPQLVEEVWGAMDTGRFSAVLRTKVRRFNGTFFRDRKALPLGREEIGELRRAAEHDWRDVEPAIFGSLLEQALDAGERRRLGAHYTPRPYVERLVVATIMEPLRDDWARALSTAERQKAEGRAEAAARTIADFHARLCETRVLDPACGTGNFLYIALELMKRLEGEVLEALADLGGQEALALTGATVDPHTFLGLEINPRAAAIAELVLWIGWLQWHFRTRGAPPSEPILKAFDTIRCDDAVLRWDGYPVPQVVAGRECLPNPFAPGWPAADFIVGNPPFIGGKDLRARLGSAYAEALWQAHPQMNESADFVMYWWDTAARVLAAPDGRLRRFGFVTTNSITQVFQRRTLARHLDAAAPVSIVFAIPDHPWTKATRDAAAVRIAMTVAERGRQDGVRREVVAESGLDTDNPDLRFAIRPGRINADLTVGVDVTGVKALKANKGLCSPGVKLHGAGFIVTPQQAEALGLGRRPGLEAHIRPYRNGRDLTARPRGVMVIDLFGLDETEVRRRFPEVYQHLLGTVRPERANQYEKSPTTDAASYLERWWVFGKPRQDLRRALSGRTRYIATVETAKHRVFQFLDAAILPDNMLVAVGSAEAWHLGVLSSRIHGTWARGQGGTLEDRPRYSKSRCFDPFPFPGATEDRRAAIGAVAEELDAHRKRVLDAHPRLTLTALYNVFERLRAGAAPDDLTADERQVFDDGLVLILKELHDRLDAAVAAAYGWPADLPEAEVLARLVALNRRRAAEEAAGTVRWLRPDYQVPRFGTATEKRAHQERQLELVGGTARRPVAGVPGVAISGPGTGPDTGLKPAFPRGELDQTTAVLSALMAAEGGGSADAATIAAGFRQGRRIQPKVAAILTALWRVGAIASADGGRTYRVRQVA